MAVSNSPRAHPTPPAAQIDAGSLIAGRYRVQHQLGEGGMASVWAVRDETNGRSLALKRLSNNVKPRHVALFEREFHILASLHHPCIVEAYDYGQDAAERFYTMELLDGSDVFPRAPMPWGEACRILRDVASALTLLHSRRLIHRDLSARNVWLAADGRVKLIDFGTMAAFGKPTDIAGTPPFIAPETLRGRDVDQRTDLYSLGALGYFLLTGRQAFYARALSELEPLWKERPRRASKRVSELARRDLPEVPAALDALIDALLSEDPLARPTTAVDVIDRLTVIASLEPDEHGSPIDSYLGSPAFVGRKAERQALRDCFALAKSGQANRVVVESASGLGRTRLIAELALEARLAGAVVLQAQPHAGRGTHEVALEYALRLLDALPAEALAAAAPYAGTLAHLSVGLRERLGVASAELAVMPQAHGEARMRVQVALRDWFLDVLREHLIVIIADDFDAFDDGSSAWLAALCREADEHQLLAVAAIRTDRGPLGHAGQALRQAATCLQLEPMALEETTELFRSVFGDVQHLARLVDLIYQRSEGNPAHALDLAEHLSREGVIRFVQGAWVLPQTVAAEALPANRLDAELARLDRLTPHARELGRALSLREGPIPLDMCAALADLKGHQLFEALESLVREGVLIGSADGYAFARESIRRALYDEQDRESLQSRHRRLGQLLLATPDITQLERLKAGVHLLRGGDDEQGSLATAIAGKHYGLVDLADLGPAAPSLEAALEHFRAAKRPLHELVSVLAPLALAGYYADRRLAERYGEQAVDALQTAVGLKTAKRLRPFLGRKVGLLVALAIAALGFAVRRKNPRIPTFKEAMMMLFNCVAALTGVCTICLDRTQGEKYASVIEPMTALGPNHVASFMHQFCTNLMATIGDRQGEAIESWTRMIDRLDQPNAARHLPENIHALYLAGALYARGVSETWRDDSRALEYASRLQSLKLKLYDMSADQLRMMHYANRGDTEEFEKYRQRVEVHAIQRGTAWQVETWTFSALITVYMRTQDIGGLKHCVVQLERLSAEVATLRVGHARALAAYCLVRGTPSEALEVVGKGEQPMQLVGWFRGEGVRARAYNALGQHASAKETCLSALGQLTPADLELCALNLGIQIELARAEAGLGNLAGAEAQLVALLDKHASAGNPLTLGTLHEVLAELAAQRGDDTAFASHVAAVGRWFRPTRDPALVARHERLARIADGAQQHLPSEAQSGSSPPRMMTVLHRLRHGGDHTRSGTAEWALKQLSDLTGSQEGYLFLVEEGQLRCAARIGSADDEGVVGAWVQERLDAFDDDMDMATSVTTDVPAPAGLRVGDRLYRITVLASSGGDDEILGAVLLTGQESIPLRVIRTLVERLASSQSLSTDMGVEALS